MAAAAGIVVWAIAVPVAGVKLIARGQDIGPISILIAVGVAGGCAWLLLLAVRRWQRGRAVWTVAGWVFLALSLIAPVVTGATGAALLTLELMHVAVGSILILGLRGAQTGGAEKRMKSTA